MVGELPRYCQINRAAFVVLGLLECGCEDVVAQIRAELLPQLDQIRALAGAGAQLLAKVFLLFAPVLLFLTSESCWRS